MSEPIINEFTQTCSQPSFLDLNFEGISEPASQPTSEQTSILDQWSDDPVYTVNKLTKLAWRIGFTAAYVPYTRKFYDTYLYYHLQDPDRDFFKANPKISSVYDSGTTQGRVMRRVFLPSSMSGAKDGELRLQGEALRESGSRHQQLSSRLMIGSNITRIAGNSLALSQCIFGDEDCSAVEVGLVSTDIGTSVTFIAVQKYHGTGAGFVAGAQTSRLAGDIAENAAQQKLAYQAFKVGKSLSVVANGFMMVNGGLRLYAEYEKITSDDPTASVAQVVDAASDLGQGAASSVYQGWLVSGAARTLATTGNVKFATDVMSVSARVIPTVMLRTMQGFGVAGGAIAFGRSGISVAEGIAGKEFITQASSDPMDQPRPLSKHDSTHMIISGSLGATSAALSIGAAILITPVGLVLGTALACGAMAFLVGMVVYDILDPLDRKG